MVRFFSSTIGVVSFCSIVLLAGSSFGGPVSASAVVARGQPVCANAPEIVAGSIFHRREHFVETVSNRLAPRRSTDSVLWCAPGSETYVILRITRSIPGAGIMLLLNTAYNSVMDVLQAHGDGLLAAGGEFWKTNNGLIMKAYNSNNHQTTWGVLGAAIQALRDYMDRNGFGAATFHIYDGANEVGAGTIG